MTSYAAPPVTVRRTGGLLLALALCVGALLFGVPPVAAATAAAAAAPAGDPVGVWPLVPRPEVVRGFDPPDDPWGAGHRGVDLLGRAGERVRSALAGRVGWSGVLAGRGIVVIDHGTTRTTYQPLDARVPVGTAVAAGDRIGLLAPTGSHCLPRACLHWGWIDGETYLDPLRLVGVARPVRLLPLGPGGPSAPVASTWAPPARAAPMPAATTLPYAAWRPVAAALVPALAQARGWACW
jgi:murein DD-endopeptidase MepM/ murein hydrolase activator NlpD